METKLGDFVIKFLQNKTETRKIIKCDDFFQLINDMGITDDSDEIISIINYLEENDTDINFHEAKTQNFYNRFRNIEKKVQMSKMLIGSKTEVQKMIEKVESVKVQERPDWLEMYRNDSTDEKIEESKMGVSQENPFQRITDMLTQELRDRLDSEPGMNLEEIQREVNIEMGISDEQIEQLKNAPEITEEQINEIKNNN